MPATKLAERMLSLAEVPAVPEGAESEDQPNGEVIKTYEDRRWRFRGETLLYYFKAADRRVTPYEEAYKGPRR